MKQNMVAPPVAGFLIAVFLGSFSLALAEQEVPFADFLDGAVYITKNPSGIAPLTAEIVFETKVPTEVSIEVLGKEPLEHHFGGRTTAHRLPLLGLYPGTDNRVVIRLENPTLGVSEDTFTVTTAPLPDYFPNIDVTRAEGPEVEPGWTLSQYSVNPSGRLVATDVDASRHLRGLPFMFDSSGDIRYYLDLTEVGGLPFEVARLKNGNWVFGEASDVFEYDVLGRRVNRWPIPGFRAHHDVAEKPNGNLLVVVHKTGTKNKDGVTTNGDHIIELERSSGKIVREWDLRNILDVYRRDLVPDVTDWFHMNAVWYDPTDDTLIVSGRSQGVVKLTKDNELVWILAPHQGWGKAGINADKYETYDYLLTAVDRDGVPYPEAVQQGTEAAPDFDWNWGQHAPMILPNGNVLLFDNGFHRHYFPPAQTENNYSRGVEYAIDEEAKTVQQVWQYGAARGSDFFSAIISDVDYLPQTHNRLIMPGIVMGSAGPSAFVTEVSSPFNKVVFDAAIRFKGAFKTEAFFGEIVYRSERLPIYP